MAVALFDLFTLFLLTQTKAHNIPLYLLFRLQFFFLSKFPPIAVYGHVYLTLPPSSRRPLPHRNKPNNPPPRTNLLLRSRKQQLHLVHRPFKLLQRRFGLQRRRRRSPRLPIQLGWPSLLVSRRHPPTRLPWKTTALHRHIGTAQGGLDCTRTQLSE